jgi:hypothetical protein
LIELFFFFFEEELLFYLLEVEIFKLLEININLANSLFKVPEMRKEILFEEVIELK